MSESQQPTPKAVEAVSRAAVCFSDYEQDAVDLITFFRDAIHGDGPEADAIRDALGLRRENRAILHRWPADPEKIRRVVGGWRQVTAPEQ